MEEARLGAISRRQFAAAIAATMSKAKILRFLADTPFEDGKTPKPSPGPTDVVEMTEEEWLARFRPKVAVVPIARWGHVIGRFVVKFRELKEYAGGTLGFEPTVQFPARQFSRLLP